MDGVRSFRSRLVVIQIDGIHMDEDMTLVAAIGVDVNGDKHPLGVVEGATENAATVQALIGNLVERGLDPLCRTSSSSTARRLSPRQSARPSDATRPFQRCQIHKARNILDRLPKSMHAQVRRTLRQAWEMDDAGKAETLLRNLARRLEKDWEGVSASILEGLDEMLTVTKLGLPPELRRSLACNEHHRERHGHGAARLPEREILALAVHGFTLDWRRMQEAAKGFRRLKAYKQLPLCKRRSPRARQEPLHRTSILSKPRRLRRFPISDARFALFNIKWDIAIFSASEHAPIEF